MGKLKPSTAPTSNSPPAPSFPTYTPRSPSQPDLPLCGFYLLRRDHSKHGAALDAATTTVLGPSDVATDARGDTTHRREPATSKGDPRSERGRAARERDDAANTQDCVWLCSDRGCAHHQAREW